MALWNLPDGGLSHIRPLLGPSESIWGGTPSTNPHQQVPLPSILAMFPRFSRGCATGMALPTQQCQPLRSPWLVVLQHHALLKELEQQVHQERPDPTRGSQRSSPRCLGIGSSFPNMKKHFDSCSSLNRQVYPLCNARLRYKNPDSYGCERGMRRWYSSICNQTHATQGSTSIHSSMSDRLWS
jgi:hypothetical protein